MVADMMEYHILKDEVLSYVYIVQNGQPDPLVRGVLWEDVRDKFRRENVDDTVDTLLIDGLIERPKVGKLLCVRLTYEGERKAASLVTTRTSKCVDPLREKIRGMTPRLMSFLFRGARHQESLDRPGGWCLLFEPKIESAPWLIWVVILGLPRNRAK